MTTLFDPLLGITTLTVNENERVLVAEGGTLRALIGPGQHRFWGGRKTRMLHRFSVNDERFLSVFTKPLFEKLPDAADAQLLKVETASNQVAVLFLDRRPRRLLGPDSTAFYWRDAGDWQVEVIDVEATSQVEPGLLKRLQRVGLTEQFKAVTVPEGMVVVLFRDGRFERTLTAGAHAFWDVANRLTTRLVTVNRQTLEVTGQELLTKDRVTIRVNLVGAFRVTDPQRAVIEVGDFLEVIRSQVQLAFRRTLGALTLDQILERKGAGDLDAAAFEAVATALAKIGVELEGITLKDVILPGEMRDLLNKVVAAQKEAEANVIRRREETNATRSLLNTAKVMADQPIMLRLKELEALETIADKVQNLTVTNGTSGLLNDLVQLQDVSQRTS